MSVRLRRTNVADNDIRDTVTYIALDGSEAANDVAHDLWDAFMRIANLPDSGSQLVGLSAPVRFVRVSSRFRRYLIIYRRVDAETVEVVRIAHDARDIPALLRDR